MGQRMDEEDIVYGNDCGYGEQFDPPLWEPGETPKYVYARFSNIKKCDKEICVPYPLPPNDRVFKLEQEDWNPCSWIYLGDWNVLWWFYPPAPIKCQLFLSTPMAGPHYFENTFQPNGVPAWDCVNELTEDVPVACGKGGIGIVSWGVKARTLLKSLNMKALSDIFMEMRPLVDGNRVYKFCRLEDATNIAIEFEPD